MAFGGAVLLFLGVSGLSLSCVCSEDIKEIKELETKSVCFPAQVFKEGFLFKKKETLAEVKDNKLVMAPNTIIWDKTSHFCIINLSKEHSGEYTVNNKEPKTETKYNLLVYGPVSKPRVQATQNTPCSLLCSVENGREVTLFWHREGQNQPVSRSSDQTLLLEIEDLNVSYTCSVSNPVSSNSTEVNPHNYCAGKALPSWAIGVIAFLVVVCIALIVYCCRCTRQKGIL